MKLPSLITAVLRKTSPASAMEQDEIEQKMTLWYEQNTKIVKEKVASGEVLTLKDKVFNHIDQWYAGILFSFGYFWAVKFIQDIMNPGSDHPDDDKYQV
jgi:hypothetical protein